VEWWVSIQPDVREVEGFGRAREQSRNLLDLREE
jgi:hypothetical protein